MRSLPLQAPIRAALPTLALLLAACSGGATEPPSIPPPSPAAETPATSPPAPAPPPEEAPDDGPFLLQLQRSSGARFGDQISVREDGQLIWVAQTQGALHAITLSLDPPEVRALRDAVADADYFDLPERTPSEVQDGTLLGVRVQTGGRSHQIVAGEPAPEGLRRVVDAVDALLTPPRRHALEMAPEATPEDIEPSLVD